MSDTYSHDLVESESSGYEMLAAATIGLGFVVFGAVIATLFELVAIDDTFAGFTTVTLLGAGLTLVGLSVVVMGIASRAEVVQTTPDATPGLLPIALYSAVWGGVVGLTVSQTFNTGPVFWVPGTVLGALVAGAVTALPREDLGATLPAGGFALFVGILVFVGVLGADFQWHPANVGVTFNPEIVVPVVTGLGVLLGSWAAAQAYDGFGSRGRQTGAYMLVSLNVIAILSVLVLLIAFVVMKGAGQVLSGFALTGGQIKLFGVSLPFVQWPFVQNGIQLLNDYNGVYPAIVGTFWLVVGAVTFALPLAVGAALFLTEYAEQGRFTQIVEMATNGLWSTPSIVFGLFGYAFLVPRLRNTTNLLAGMLVLGFMLLPLVLITAREALIAVPDSHRDASAALGATQWQTIRSVVIPAAMPGIITGVILGVGRIAGETAPILLVLGGTPEPSAGQAPNVVDLGFQFTGAFPFVQLSVINNEALLTSATALPLQLYAFITAGLASDLGENFGWGVALVLLMVVLSFYAIGIVSRNYFRNKLQA